MRICACSQCLFDSCCCMPQFVFIYYVLNIGIHLPFLCNPSVILIFEHYVLKLLHVFPSETRFVLYADIIFVHYTLFFIFIITSCNYLFIISTCHVISSVIFWRHAQQVAYHVIYKVLVTWHMIFQKKYFMCTILISFLWIKCFKDIYFSRVFILTKIVNDLKDLFTRI